MALPFPKLTADEAAAMIQNGQNVGFSGFTSTANAKVIPPAIARRAEAAHAAGREFKIGVLTGASTGPLLDGVLAKANAVGFRTPYQSNPDLRGRINAGDVRFVDMHLSVLSQWVRYGFYGSLPWAVLEACDVTAGGGLVLTTSVGATPTYGRVAEKILIELNHRHPATLLGMHDIYEPADPPYRREIPIYLVSDRIGSPIMQVDPSKIVGIVETELDDEVGAYHGATPETEAIGNHVAEFLAAEIAAGRIPSSFLPIQSGVGNVANSVLGALGRHPSIPPFEMYTEVVQDSVIDLICNEQVKFASTCALTVTNPARQRIYDDLAFFRKHVVMRPMEISNNPEVVRRLGVISINTAIELDVFGNVNSTHIMGRQLMNGIGGSGDFTRAAYLSIFTTPSTAKDGKISAIVPLVSHADHSEHSVQVVVTEQGIADLRGHSPHERAELIIQNCAHPDYREALENYVHMVKKGHTPQTLQAAFAFHRRYLDTGDMHGVNCRALAEV